MSISIDDLRKTIMASRDAHLQQDHVAITINLAKESEMPAALMIAKTARASMAISDFPQVIPIHEDALYEVDPSTHASLPCVSIDAKGIWRVTGEQSISPLVAGQGYDRHLLTALGVVANRFACDALASITAWTSTPADDALAALIEKMPQNTHGMLHLLHDDLVDDRSSADRIAWHKALLRQGIGFDAPSGPRATPAILLAASGLFESLSSMLQAGADPLTADGKDNVLDTVLSTTPLSFGVAYQMALASVLEAFERRGETPGLFDGGSPLRPLIDAYLATANLHTANNGFQSVLEVLVEAGIDPNEANAEDGAFKDVLEAGKEKATANAARVNEGMTRRGYLDSSIQWLERNYPSSKMAI